MLERLMDPGPRVTEFESLLHISWKIEVPPTSIFSSSPRLQRGALESLL